MISDLLLQWYDKNKRDLPWRNTNSPYKIWLSEIILQQTRINQGLEYYNRFVDRFPTVEDLAATDVDEVLKLWQGLGYYSRARNLHETAVTVVRDHGGSFPSSYDKLARLKGVGPYTAAAVASFAFGEAVPLTDGNVYRLISRLFDIDTPINTAKGKKLFLEYASALLNFKSPGIHNQAIMEFGALVCTPARPLCDTCVLAVHCKAYKNGTVQHRPVKQYRGTLKVRHLNYLYYIVNGYTWIRKRTGKDIWNSLYEFPLIETTGPASFDELLKTEPWSDFFTGDLNYSFLDINNFSHRLSHQLLYCSFYRVISGITPQATGFIETGLPDLHKYAIPRVIERYLEELS